MRPPYAISLHPFVPRALRYLGVIVLAMLFHGGMLGCGDAQIVVPGCEVCPDKCLQDDKGRARCVACLNDGQCRAEATSTKQCNDDNKCVCGSDVDCPNGSHCSSTKGCVACLNDSHCTNKERPFCTPENSCVSCQPNTTEACTPKDLEVCTPGVRRCKASGLWDQCLDYKRCEAGETCVEQKCVPTCPPAPCQLDEKKCTSKEDDIPGTYVVCVKDGNGCLAWGTAEEKCEDKERCNNGSCSPRSCDNKCKEGEVRCVDTSQSQSCIKDKDGCFDWDKGTVCPNGELCVAALNRCVTCAPNSTKGCYTGPANTKDKGSCKSGKQVCKADGSGYEACSNDVKPTTEQCDGLDNNCDGSIDEGLEKPCYSGPANTKGKGICKEGKSICQNGTYGSCTGEVKPGAEKCGNKLDDNCDGRVDEADGRAITFTGGNDKLSFPNVKAYDLGGSFTMELWVYFDGLGTRNIALLLNKHKAQQNQDGYHLKIQKENGVDTLGFSWWNQTRGNQILFGAAPIKQWFHIALVYDGSTKTYRCYVNGALKGQGTQTMTIGANTHPLLFATETAPTSGQPGDVQFRGQLAAIRLSNSARYNAPFTPSCTWKTDAQTIGLWNLEDGYGSKVTDSSATANHGTLSGNGAKWSKGRSCNAINTGGCTP